MRLIPYFSIELFDCANDRPIEVKLSLAPCLTASTASVNDCFIRLSNLIGSKPFVKIDFGIIKQ